MAPSRPDGSRARAAGAPLVPFHHRDPEDLAAVRVPRAPHLGAAVHDERRQQRGPLRAGGEGGPALHGLDRGGRTGRHVGGRWPRCDLETIYVYQMPEAMHLFA